MTLRARLLLSFSLIVIFCLAIAAVIVTVLFQGLRDRIATNQLEDMSRPIFVQFQALTRATLTPAEVWSNLQEQAQSNNVYIILTDRNNNIRMEANPDGTSQPLNVQGDLPQGSIPPVQGTLTTAGGQKFLFTAYANRAAVSKLPGETLILAVPRSGPVAIWASIIGPFFWAAVIALIISILAAFFLARSIYRPVQRLAGAAENVAQGKYDEKIPETGPRELKELAANFNGMSAKVKESQFQLRHFVADVSHQLKSPLTSIQGFAQAMVDGTAGDEPTRLKASQIIVEESRRMIRQVNELLDLSRMQGGQVKMAREPVDLRQLLLQCQEIFAVQAQEKNLKMTFRIDPLMPVTGDEDRLEDVFSNLLDNAIKNTPLHGEINVTGRNVGDNVEVTVADSGPGIPPEQIPFVFKRFYQAGSGLRTGVGLGLAIAQEIVLAHGGKITVTSDPGEGAHFTVVLPVALPPK